MKRFNLISIIFLLGYSTGSLADFHLGPECINLIQLNRAGQLLCKDQRHNQTLWSRVVQCHRPMTDEFLRSSAEARCPVSKTVQNPSDTKHSIEEVFFNICGIVQGNPLEIIQGAACLIAGNHGAGILSHKDEVNAMKKKWGKDIACNIGKCIKTLGLHLG